MKNIVKSKGVALLEFTLAVPVLILLIIVLYETSRLYYVYMRFIDFNWEGTRFFSSLTDPPPACISPETTNLSYARSAYVNSLDTPTKTYLFQTHKTVQDRVLALFFFRGDTWPIESDGLIPTGEVGSTTRVKDLSEFRHTPTISTQFVKDNATQNCPPPMGGSLSNADMDNTVTVCMEATYVGPFFSWPLRTCSTSHLLDKNETLRIPQRPRPGRSGYGGYGGGGGGYGGGGGN